MPVVNPFQGPEWEEYAKQVREELVPMVGDSSIAVLSVVPPDKLDVAFAVQLGCMILLDKPIIAIVNRGSKVPNKLAIVADEIVEGSIGEPGFETRFRAAISRITAKLEDL